MTFPPLETTMNHLLKKLGLILCFALTFAGQSFGQGALKVTQKADVKKSLQLVLSESHAAITPNSLRSLLKTLTEEPHVAGTPADLKTAEFVRERLRSWGWSAEFVSYDVLLNYPISPAPGSKSSANPVLEITRPSLRALPVTEKAWALDKDSTSTDAWPAFHGYGVSGTAEGQVVYANYGRPEDFETLTRMGVDVRNRIVLVRYGKLFRGLKLREAQMRGAKGMLVFSDPADDGYMKGDVYPNGPYRPGSAVQRGSVQFLSFGPGDPTTPGLPSVPGAARLPIDVLNGFPLEPKAKADWEARTGLVRQDYFAAIPSLPISYDAARPILEKLAGSNVPEGWQGGLPLAYHTGPGPVEVRFSITMDYKIRKIWNVVARLEGKQEQGRNVMIGNHRDAWTYGAVDPSSGTAATMEMCRVLGQAYGAGWRPRRTLVYASWDAEEYGLVGSTEYAEQFGESLKKETALMLNVDSAVSGSAPRLELEGIPSLRDLLLESASTVTDPRSGQSLKSQWLKAARSEWAAEEPVILDDSIWTKETQETKNKSDTTGESFSPKLGDLGSGSDYTAFVDHLGIPAANVDFSGRYGVYHSIYDNFYWMEKFGDPEFIQHATAARLYTSIILKASSENVLPLRFKPYGEAIEGYLNELRRMVIKRNRLLEGDGQKNAFEIPNLKPLAQAILNFQKAASQSDDACQKLSEVLVPEESKLESVNAAITAVERSFLSRSGLPGRKWYKHVIYAPGLTTGYAAWPLPGLRQAVNNSDQKMADEQSKILIECLESATRALDLVSTRAK
ncbi:MAG: transferrin receptor-like dimerization domain-containing protein [Planctomycetota bacterium]